MVGTIIPIVYGETFGKAVRLMGVHTLGYLCGGAVFGSFLGFLGSVTLSSFSIETSVILRVTGIVGLLYSFHELGLVDIPAPQFKRQVPSSWRGRFSAEVAGFLYGLGLGTGVATRVPVRTFYVVLLWVALSQSALLGACCLVSFGLGRAAPLIWIRLSIKSKEQAWDLMEGNWRPWVNVANGIALAFCGATMLAHEWLPI